MKWIKVKDRLPEKGKPVIVRDAKGHSETYKLTEYGWNLQNQVLGSNEPAVEWLDENTPDEQEMVRIMVDALERIVECTGTSTLQNKIAREALFSRQ